MRIDVKSDRVTMSENEYRQVMNELNQYKKAYQHCVDDLIVLRANTKRLERELAATLNGELATYDELQKYVLELQKDLNTYFDEWQSVKKLYTALTSHIRTKAEMNPGVSRYIDLVNYIDRLERN